MENFILGQWSTFERIPFCFGVEILINKPTLVNDTDKT